MTNITKASGDRGPLHDQFSREPDDSNADFARQLAAAPQAVRSLPAACPSCGHRHTLNDALWAARPAKRDESGRSQPRQTLDHLAARAKTDKARRSPVDVEKIEHGVVIDGKPDDCVHCGTKLTAVKEKLLRDGKPTEAWTAACKTCGTEHIGITKSVDPQLDVRKSDDASIRPGVGKPETLHEALAAQARAIYGIR